MRRLLVAVVALGLVGMAGAALADEHDFEPHPHMLVIGLEFDDSGEPVDFKKCVDLAAGQALPIKAQHRHVHFGNAGEALFERAGHAVVPGAPFPSPFVDPLPWSNCQELIAFFFGG